jgi:cellulose synthase/poly-beta-1,6-N-acetylglucosamine synthase-like glycosyltransferase
MCNGANLAYTKKIFHEVNGFEGNSTIASGDDVFLLQKVVVQFPEKVGFLSNSNYVVETNSAQSWKELFYQRVRWAGKATAYSSLFGKLVALIVLFGNLAFLMAIPLLSIGYFKLIPIFILKILVDLFLANQTAAFYQIRMNNRLLTALFYPFFSSAVALYSLFGKYEWKDRKV